jgi:hypothetical protein
LFTIYHILALIFIPILIMILRRRRYAWTYFKNIWFIYLWEK